jgi:hypothetical protein
MLVRVAELTGGEARERRLAEAEQPVARGAVGGAVEEPLAVRRLEHHLAPAGGAREREREVDAARRGVHLDHLRH